jgi:hypothetical protein
MFGSEEIRLREEPRLLEELRLREEPKLHEEKLLPEEAIIILNEEFRKLRCEEPMYQDTAKQQRIARLKQEAAMLLNKNY